MSKDFPMTTKAILFPAVGLLLGACAAAGQTVPPGAPAVRAAGAPAPASRPATWPASQPVDPNALRILQDLETAGQKYATLQADVRLHVEKTLVGDEETSTGKIIVARGGPSAPDRFYVRFDTLQQGDGPTRKEVVEYALDGQWVTLAKHAIKDLKRWQVSYPGQKVELLRLGKGPFQIPFGQKADDVLTYFHPTTRPPARGDPNGTLYVNLVTRPQFKDEIDYIQTQMWVDRQSLLPVKVVTFNKNKDITTVTFSNVQTNPKVDEKLFIIDYKASDGWTITIEPLPKR
jgi:hypothetical protein